MSTLDLHKQHDGKTGNAELLVINATSSKVRTFLYELAEGTSYYRSLHSLTEQVEHQYHGRFIVELIQNAHDALQAAKESTGAPSRIELALRDEGEFGALYIANDGKPFSNSNFNSLSQLGQSDKNPQESVGNKGIGFRSVLEITNSPEIYSRQAPNSTRFDGFRFSFSPDVIRRLKDPILSLFNGDDRVPSPFGDTPLVDDWDVGLLNKFRESVIRLSAKESVHPEEWLSRELSYLSPYLLPFPIDIDIERSFVGEYEEGGFSTLIRLPLKSSSIRSVVREKLEELDSGALLFLDRASSLVLDSGEARREILRKQLASLDSRKNRREVTITEGAPESARRYWIWSRDIAISEAPEDVREALRQLPGKWPQLQNTRVSVGVRLGEAPDTGTLSIFLPTLLGTGCAAQINASFFGDMSRTQVEFGNDERISASGGGTYNHFLLLQAARLAISVAHEELVGGDVDEARIAVDLLAPLGTDLNAVKRWQQLIARAAAESKVDLKTAPWFLSDQGWVSLGQTALLPALKSPSILTPNNLRSHATFIAYVKELDSRRESIKAIANAQGADVHPATGDLANTIESIALTLHKDSETDWNAFWSEVDELFCGNCSALQGKRVLLGNDGNLHAGGSDDCTVFFSPRQGASDDEDVDNEADSKEIPESLRPFVAFLSDHISVYEEKGGRLQQTRIRNLLLQSKLVSRFKREDILNDVLIPRIPRLPVLHTAPETVMCRDVLLWALRLMANLVDSGKGEKSLRLLKPLPAPCIGGWYPLSESSFGPGWTGTQGEVTLNYLARITTEQAIESRKRMLLPPSNERWAGNGNQHVGLLRKVGVFDGLQLTAVETKSWSSNFQAPRNNFLLPQIPPPGWSDVDWGEYRSYALQEATPYYQNGTYEIQRLYALPGLDRYPEFDDETRVAFMNAVIGSIAHWEEGWDGLAISKIGGNTDTTRLTSPLAHKLRTMTWLGISDGDVTVWSRPADRWHVPALILAGGRKWQFSHLNPLPGTLADLLDRDSRLAERMWRLGTPRFNPEAGSPSTQLLDALANAVARGDVPHRDVFLGQVRSAWRGFEPTAGSAFPRKLLVQRGASKLIAEIPAESGPIYLPDSAKTFLSALRQFELPVIAIETDDAKRLAELFTAAYPGDVILASTLEPIPLVDGAHYSDTSQDRLCENAELRWLIPVLLTIAGFYGARSQGSASKSFREHLKTFRNIRLLFAENIETALFREGKPIAPPISVPALWLSGEKVLLLTHAWKNDISALSEALSNALDREELEVPIKLLLRITGCKPDSNEISKALEQIKLSGNHLGAVREHWRADLGQIIEMLVPLLTILKPDVDIGEIVTLESDDELTAYLDNLDGGPFNGIPILQIARDSANMFEFGQATYSVFGEVVQLSAWNSALSLRDQQPLVNNEAEEEFRAHINSSAMPIRSLIAAVIARRPELGAFRDLSNQADAITCPDEIKTNYWSVCFNRALSALTPLLEQWYATPEELVALCESQSIDDLLDRLRSAGIDVDSDPLETARNNREKLRAALMRFQQIGLAWALDSGYANPADWESRIDKYLSQLSAETESAAFTHQWDDDFVWSLVCKLPADVPSAVFWKSVTSASGFESLAHLLGISSEMLTNANARLDAHRDEARRKERIVEVCGREFDGSEENLAGLWQHICSAIPATELGDLAQLDIKNPSALETISTQKSRHLPNRASLNATKSRRPSKSMENLIGLCGEIHAFRKLQCDYGTSTVSASSWISENSLIVFPDNKASDGAGCDLIISLRNRTYHIEVKSTEAESKSFTMGSSEIRLAMLLAEKSSSRSRNVFLIMRVYNALSSSPSFCILPNPYATENKSIFLIEEADARIRYREQTLTLPSAP